MFYHRKEVTVRVTAEMVTITDGTLLLAARVR